MGISLRSDIYHVARKMGVKSRFVARNAYEILSNKMMAAEENCHECSYAADFAWLAIVIFRSQFQSIVLLANGSFMTDKHIL